MENIRRLMFGLMILASSMTFAQLADSKPMVSVEGSAIINVKPDQVVMNFTISKRASTLDEVRRMNAKTTAEVIDFLVNSKVKESDIQTQYVNIGPKLDYKTQKIEYFNASQHISVNVKNIDHYEKIVDGLIRLGIYSVGNPVFKTSQEKKLKDEARKSAMIKAKEKALLLAKTLGQDIGKAHYISDIENTAGFQPRAYANSMRSIEADDNVGTGFATGQIQIKATVRVQFELL